MNRKRIIALGMFDGVHMGHRALIARARQIAKESSCETVVLRLPIIPLRHWAKR